MNKKPKPMLSNIDWKRTNWQVCPKCATEDISASPFDDGGMGEVYRLVECKKCGYEWREVYIFSYNEEA